MIEQPDGTMKLDVEMVTQYALKLGQDSELVWQTEDQNIHLHPIQIAPPERTSE